MNSKLKNEIASLIQCKVEGEYWDFKQEWHKDNEKLLHDILCFANTVHIKDCYLIIGVSDDGEVVGVSEENRRKQAQILDMLSNTVFAGDYTPEISLDTIKLYNKEVDVLTIFNSFNTPFYLKRKNNAHSKIVPGYIYTRLGDKNTPITENATILQVEMLWKKRFGLTRPPLIQIKDRLLSKEEWESNEDAYYNIYKPEFQLVVEDDDDDFGRKRGEFYVYTQTNSSFSYQYLKIMYNKTILKELQIVVLDSGRYKTPIPEWGYAGYDKYRIHHKFTYKYFLKDSFSYRLQQFFFDTNNEEEVYAKKKFDEVILYFEDDQEREQFEYYLEVNQKLADEYVTEADNEYFSIDTDNDNEESVVRNTLSVGLALNRMLTEYRLRLNE